MTDVIDPVEADKALYRLNSPNARAMAVQHVQSAPDGHVVEIKAPTRSLEQNALLWARLEAKDEGALWSRIRSVIEGMPDIEKAIKATRYEEASAHWDAAARKITEEVAALLSREQTGKREKR
jgi:hypothetical protein